MFIDHNMIIICLLLSYYIKKNYIFIKNYNINQAFVSLNCFFFSPTSVNVFKLLQSQLKFHYLDTKAAYIFLLLPLCLFKASGFLLNVYKQAHTTNAI